MRKKGERSEKKAKVIRHRKNGPDKPHSSEHKEYADFWADPNDEIMLPDDGEVGH